MTAPASEKSVLIIGAGIVGIACAHYLSKAGYAVTVIDRGGIAAACSSQNCGHILPSHVLPLNSIDALRTAFGSFFDRASPFRVKFRFEPAFVNWMWQFTRRCNTRHIAHAAMHLKALIESSYREYETLADDPSFECGWDRNGFLYLFKGSKSLEAFGKTNRWLCDTYDIEAEEIEGRDLPRFDPALREGLAGGYFYRDDASLDPARLGFVWSERLKKDGVRFIENCTFLSAEEAGGAITALHTDKGVFAAGQVVLATGAMSRALSRHFGTALPVEPGKGYSITLARPSLCPKPSIGLAEDYVNLTPFADGLRIGSMMEFIGFDDTLPPFRIEQLKGAAEHYLRADLPEIRQSWFGWRPMTPDSLPIIGRFPKIKNAYAATGHQMVGVMAAPATGKLIAELMSGQTPHIPDTPFSPARFG